MDSEPGEKWGGEGAWGEKWRRGAWLLEEAVDYLLAEEVCCVNELVFTLGCCSTR